MPLRQPPSGRWPRSRPAGRRRRSGWTATRRAAPWCWGSRPPRAGRRGRGSRWSRPVDDHRHAAGQGDGLGVGGPVRGRHEHLVAGVAQDGERVGDGLLPAVGDQDLRGGHLEARVPLGLGRDGLAQLGEAGRRRVAVVRRVAAGGLGGLHDVLRRGEVGLAGAEADDALPRRLERLGLGIDGQGRRGRDGGDPARDPAGEPAPRRGAGRFWSGHGCHDSIRDRHPRHHASPPICCPPTAVSVPAPPRCAPSRWRPSPRWPARTSAPATARRRSSRWWAGCAPGWPSCSPSPTATRWSSATGARPASGTRPPSG